MYVRYSALVVVSLLASLLNFPLAPLVVLFASEDGWLPRWLWWFQTPDNPLDGDNGWKVEHRPYKQETSEYQRWVNRTFWLYRNSMYGFCIDVLGAKTLGSDILVTEGDTATSNRPIHSGLVRRTLYREGRAIYFQWYYVKQWSAKYCLRVNLGWKLWSFRQGQDINCQLTFSPNPAMGLST